MNRLLSLTLCFSLGAFVLTGCSENKAEEPKPDAQASAGSATGGFQVVNGVYSNAEGKPVCPVMGDVVESADKAFKVMEHDGVKYYICCAMCPEKFEKDPHQYSKLPHS